MALPARINERQLSDTPPSAAFEVQGERSRVSGALHFTTVTALLQTGSDAIANGHAAVIDLTGVADSDSSGLALLIEWLSVAKAAGRTLRYENIPAQLRQLANLSDVEELLAGG
jgi:phospholipid transport system transporter-binding protein